MPKRVLILSASVGTGHIHAAQAIQNALLSNDSEAVIRHEDALEFANPAFRNLMRHGYNELANNAPEVLGLAYEYSERVWSTEIHGVAFERWNSGDLIKLSSEFRPDLVVCTHPLPADMTSWLICKKRLWAQHAVVLTDFDLNTMWLCQHYSGYFVALEETLECMVNIGYERSRIIVSGIPADPIFAVSKDKMEMRKKYGLESDSICILISAGGLGVGPVAEEILPALMKLSLKGNIQIVAICGNNQELKHKLDVFSEQITASSNMALKVFGQTSDMDELMSAADLILGKPGGLTVAEALSKGLPFVIVNPIPGQEERNSDHLLEAGAAIRCHNLAGLAYKMGLLLNDVSRLASMHECALRFARPRAAETIARELLAMIEKPRGCASHPPEHSCDGSLLDLV